MADEELKTVSEYTDIFANDDSSWEDKMKSIKDIWEGIKHEAEVYNDQNLQNALALEAILDDERDKAKKAAKHDIDQKKVLLKIEMQIAKARNEANAKEEKALNKRLETVKKLQDQEKKYRENINRLTEEYGDILDAANSKDAAKKEWNEQRNNLISQGLKSGDLGMIKSGLTGGEEGGKGFVNALDKMTHTLAGLVSKLDKSIEEIAAYKSDWDTRLFGSGKSHTSLTSAIQFALGVSPYVKQADVLRNIDKAIDTGIAYNIEQRAFLETIKDDIAGTFDAFDSTLLQIIRVQQADSTAARMGMEVSLNKYFNQMYKNTEYLSNVSDSVTSALYEATSLLSASESVGFEYQVQKWLGSLYSVGMSNQGVSSIAQALGQLASGDVSGTSSGAGKLLVMAASRAGLSYSDLLTKGINDSDINTLMESMVDYLRTIADSNKVVQTQLAGVFGLRTSDIRAAGNLTNSDIKNIYGKSLSYAGGVGALQEMAATIWTRMSSGEMMTNLIDNFKSTLATGIANNPILYTMWTISNMLDQLVGGIPIPTIGAWAVGNGTEIDLETTVADIMRVGALSGSLLSGIGSIVSGLATNSVGLSGVLTALGVRSNASTISRGTGLNSLISPRSRSLSGYQGNTSGSDIYDSSMAGAEDQKNELAVQAQEPEGEEDIKLADLNATVLQIYDLLQTVIIGGRVITGPRSYTGPFDTEFGIG